MVYGTACRNQTYYLTVISRLHVQYAPAAFLTFITIQQDGIFVNYADCFYCCYHPKILGADERIRTFTLT